MVIMPCCLEPDDVPFSDSESISTDILDIFSGNRFDDSSESESDRDDLDDDDNDDKKQLPLEHCLAEAENFDVSQLRQQQYGPYIQEKLKETRKYWDW